MSFPKRIFIAATLQNEGKTTFSIGLIAALKKRFKNIGFIKPIGQRYLVEQGFKVDEDSVLVDRVFDLGRGLKLKDLSPVAVEKGFTEKYIDGKAGRNYVKDILDSFKKISQNSDVVIIEGTGHAGVGSVFDLSNAAVAKLLGSRVILIAPGGIGRPIDEVMLNKSLFDREGVELAGVVVNKVLPQKYEKVEKYVRMGFEKKGISVLGILPYQRKLDLPTVREILEEIKIRLLCGEENLDTTVDRILIGAMVVKDALKYIVDNSLIITAFDREDIIKAVTDLHKGKNGTRRNISGLILSGGIEPPEKTMKLLEESGIPTLLSEKDTYSVASQVHSMKVKIKPEDKNKIELIIKMVHKYSDMEKIIGSL